jgi:hypothetical protein
MEPLVATDADHVARAAAELIANRLRAGRRVDVRVTGPLGDAIRGALAAEGDVAAPHADLIVLDPADAIDDVPDARELLVVAAGATQAAALAGAVDGRLSVHPCATALADPDAAAAVADRPGGHSDHAVVVLGHREPGISAEHRVSEHSHARLRRAEAICRRHPPQVLVLTGWTSTGGLSEAEQMARWWTLDDVPLLLEVAGRDTAENASRTLPLLLALGAVRRVIVVTSAWHLRTRYLFAPYRRHGLRVDHRRAHDLGPGLPHLLAIELGGATRMRHDRREAMGAVALLDPRPLSIA